MLLNVEVAVGARHDDLVARTERIDVGRRDAGIDIHETRAVGLEGRRGDAHSKHEDIALVGIVGHRIGSDRRFGIDTTQVEHAELLPCGQILGTDKVAVVIGIAEVELRNLNLGIRARRKVHVLASRQLHLELLHKGGHIAVGNHGALILLDAEYGLGHGNFEVFFHLHLAAQPPVVLNLLAGEETHLGGKDGAAAFQHTAFALAARPLPATG